MNRCNKDVVNVVVKKARVHQGNLVAVFLTGCGDTPVWSHRVIFRTPSHLYRKQSMNRGKDKMTVIMSRRHAPGVTFKTSHIK